MDWKSGTSGKQKRFGFGVLWIPTRKNRKRNNYYVRHTEYGNRSIMATDSPTPDHKDHINYSADSGRMTPPPTTSYSKPEVAVDSSLSVEPTKEDKDKDESDFSRPDANPDSNPEKVDSGKDKGNSKSSAAGGADVTDKNKEDSKLNGGDNRLESKWVSPPTVADEKDDSEEKDCAVNCIYYTLQCCECTIT